MMMDAPSEGLTHKDHQGPGQMVLVMITESAKLNLSDSVIAVNV